MDKKLAAWLFPQCESTPLDRSYERLHVPQDPDDPPDHLASGLEFAREAPDSAPELPERVLDHPVVEARNPSFELAAEAAAPAIAERDIQHGDHLPVEGALGVESDRSVELLALRVSGVVGTCARFLASESCDDAWDGPGEAPSEQRRHRQGRPGAV